LQEAKRTPPLKPDYFAASAGNRLAGIAHSRFRPVPGAFSKTQRVGGVPQTLSRFLKPTHFWSGPR
jgi:hypothetical protein